MITLEKKRLQSTLISKSSNDGRMVVLDSSKIYEVILKASEAITPITPLIGSKVERNCQPYCC